MLKIDRGKKTFSTLQTPDLSALALTERTDLQEYIYRSPHEFFHEIGEDLFLVDKEVEPSKTVQDRIDLLAVDRDGNAVVIELKRGNDKLHLLQVISYAGMISGWSFEEMIDQLKTEERCDALKEFLRGNAESFNQRQRLILVAEAFDYAVLVAAKWLAEQHDVDIRCCRLSLSKDASTGAEYLSCTSIFPQPELAALAIARGRGKTAPARWSDWPTALSMLINPALISFFEKELTNGQENYLPKRSLNYRIDDSQRWSVEARREFGYVWQYARFSEDIHFWKQGLSQPESVSTVNEQSCLRFRLATPQDFQYFKAAVTQELLSALWNSAPRRDDLDQQSEGIE